MRCVRAGAIMASVSALDLTSVRVRPVTKGRVGPDVPFVALNSLLDSTRGTVIFAVRRPG